MKKLIFLLLLFFSSLLMPEHREPNPVSQAESSKKNQPESRKSEVPVEPDLSKEENTKIIDKEDSISIKNNTLNVENQIIREEYVIQPGDTLWGICVKFLGDPNYWPKLWELNQYILNPHLIYPGNIVVFKKGRKGEPVVIEIKNELGDIEMVEEDTKTVEASFSMSDDIKVAPIEKDKDKFEGLEIKKKKKVEKQSIQIKLNIFLTEKEISSLGSIKYSESENVMLSKNSIVYVQFDNPSNISPGDSFMIYKMVKEIRDPDSYFTILGYYYVIKGSLKILSTKGSFFIARIIEVNEEIHRGDLLGAMDKYSKIRSIKTRQSDFYNEGRIVGSSAEKNILGEKDLVFIDLGKSSRVKIGDKFNVISWGELSESKGEDFPEIIKANIILVSVYNHISIGLIFESNNLVEISDKIKADGIFKTIKK